ncbi:MAG: hypothetical protein KJ000_27880 [Pirellulaceae bacterium]|nr:hypothetical protein [Pirellulaceae bacterium]
MPEIILQQFRQRHVMPAIIEDRGNRDTEAGDDQRVDFALLDSRRTGSPGDVLTAPEMG